MTGVLIRSHRKQGHTYTWGEGHVKSEGDGDCDTIASQGILRIVGSHQRLGRGKERFLPRAFRRRMALPTS